VIENFISVEKCKELISECNKLTDNFSLDDIKKLSVFEANSESSIDKIRPFLESDAGKILDNIKEGDPVNKCVFNKIGHALHVFNPAFREVTFGDNVKVCYFNNQIRPIS